VKASGGKFRVYAIGDKVLAAEGVKYLLFYDYDGPKYVTGGKLPSGARLFPTPNGFHVVGRGLFSATEKSAWYTAWRSGFPSDYRLANLNWLAPHSKAELDFILDQIEGAEILKCSYYTDKQVWREFEGFAKAA
jgi:hypothetical protein